MSAYLKDYNNYFKIIEVLKKQTRSNKNTFQNIPARQSFFITVSVQLLQ